MSNLQMPPTNQATSHEPVEQGSYGGQAKWLTDGPKVKDVEVLGYVEPPNQPHFSRDIGRSFTLGGRIYYVFGDTFCNDAGISSNTVQWVPDHTKPQNAYYLKQEKNGLVIPLIDLNDDEKEELTYPMNKDRRIAFWCFGGVVEVSPGVGWTWYQKHWIDQDGSDELCGVGVARISHDKDKQTAELSCVRMPGLMFDRKMPLFGSFSTLIHGDMVYLWGQRGADIFLARVIKESCHQFHCYEFWNGKEYVFNVEKARPVLQDFQQGQVFESSLFGPKLPWVFVGVTKWADSMVMIGVASELEGPWDVRPLFRAEGIKQPNAYQYCVYAHPWGVDRTRNELLVSWCDPWPGGVILARVNFEAHDRVFWASIAMDSCSGAVALTTAMKAHEVSRGNRIECTNLANPPRLYLAGGDDHTVQMALNAVRQHMLRAMAEEAVAAGTGRRRGSGVVGFLAKVFGRRG
ncbi:MAG: hypothetical protein Q9207_004223 [Kuettlingeria erythrocarpa]